MWFGTRNGLNRYDGTRITVFRNDIHNSKSISDNLVRDIHEDKQKNLWIATNRGLDRFVSDTETFEHYSPNNTQIVILDICEDRKGKLWLGTSAGLLYFDSKQRRFVNWKIPKGAEKLSAVRVNKITEDRNGLLWVGTEQGLYLLNHAKHQAKAFMAKKGDPAALQSSKVHEIIEDTKGRVWIGMSIGGLALFNPQTESFKTYQTQTNARSTSLAHNDVDCITEGDAGILWIGTENGGLCLFDTKKELFTTYLPMETDPGSLSHDSIHSIYKDNQGNIWIGTWAGGINFYSPTILKFPLYNKFPNTSSTGVESIMCDSSGYLWLGVVGNALYRFDPIHHKYSYYSNPNSAGIAVNVYSIKEFNKDTLVLATRRGGMAFFDKNRHTFTHFLPKRGDNTSISGNELITVCVDKAKNVWCGGWEIGLSRYNRGSKNFTNYRHNPKDKNSLGSNQIYSIVEDGKKNIWIGTEDGGLNLYNPGKDNFIRFVSQSGNHSSISSNTVFSLFEDSKKRFWVGTSNGLNLLDRKTGKFEAYAGKNILADYSINSIIEDDQGNLWLGTDRGLYRFNPGKGSVRQFDIKDGLQGHTFLHNAVAKDLSGNLYFSGYKGLNVFHPSRIHNNKFAPPVIITGLSVANKPVTIGSTEPLLPKHISQIEELVLSYKQSVFALSFAALSYTSPESNEFAYKMEGFEDSWNYVGSSQTASYTKLEPGEYTFRVIAANSDGVWNRKGTSLRIIITPPFWATWWFRILIVLLLIYLTYRLLSYRRQQELKVLEENKRKELQSLQLKFFTNISHEFRTPLSLITGPLETLINSTSADNLHHYYNVMLRNVNRLMNLVNELMDFSKIESGALKLRVTENNVNMFVNQIAEDFEIHATERQMTYEVSVSNNRNVWFDRQIVEKIMLNLISNSFKYTSNGGKVSVQVFDKMEDFNPHFENTLLLKSDYPGNDYLYFRIIDTGIGISKGTIDQLFERYYRIANAHLGSGIGLAFVKSLTLLHKGKIFVSSEKSKGTEIIIAIPSGKGDYTLSEIYSGSETSVQLESLQALDELLPSADFTQYDNLDKGSSSKTKHILIVDDNDELRQFLKNSLKDEYKITEAGDGIQGIQKAKEVFPDLIISDVMMPDMDGLQFCRELKNDIETSHIPFLLLTAKSTLDSEIEGIDSGADFYFRKPVSIKLLGLTLRNIFQQKQKLIDRYTKNYQAEVKELVHSTKDKNLLEKLIATIESHLMNPQLDIDFLCSELGMSRTSLYNKIKNLTDLSLVDFLRKVRLRKALDIMLHEDVQISEVMYRVGIQSQSHFTRAFKKEFGKTPSKYLKEIERKES